MLNTEIPLDPGPPPPPTASIDGHHQNHAFISDSHKDRAWVDTCLLPVLEQAGMRVVIDDRDFDIGSWPETTWNGRGREPARLLVVGPNWIESEWTGPSSLRESIDPDGRRRKLLSILIARRAPEASVIHICANFVDPDGYERGSHG